MVTGEADPNQTLNPNFEWIPFEQAKYRAIIISSSKFVQSRFKHKNRHRDHVTATDFNVHHRDSMTITVVYH